MCKDNAIIESIIAEIKNLNNNPKNPFLKYNFDEVLSKTNVKNTQHDSVFESFILNTHFHREITSLMYACGIFIKKDDKELTCKILEARDFLFLKSRKNIESTKISADNVNVLDLILDIYCLILSDDTPFSIDDLTKLSERYSFTLRDKNIKDLYANKLLAKAKPLDSDVLWKGIYEIVNILKKDSMSIFEKTSYVYLLLMLIAPFEKYNQLICNFLFFKMIWQDKNIKRIKFFPVFVGLQTSMHRLSKILRAFSKEVSVELLIEWNKAIIKSLTSANAIAKTYNQRIARLK